MNAPSQDPWRVVGTTLLVGALVGALGGCEAVLALGPEPDRDAATSDSSSSLSGAGPAAGSTTTTAGSSGQGGHGEGAASGAVQGGAGGAGQGGAGQAGAGGSSSAGGGGPASPYAEAVLADEPILYLRLGETSGTTAVAVVGPSGQYVGDAGSYALNQPGLIINDPDTAVHVKGGGVDLGDFADFEGAQPYSLEAWVKPPPEDGAEDGYHRVLSKEDEDSDGERDGYDLWLHNGELAVERFVAGAGEYAFADVPVDGSAFHVVATFDGVVLRLYVDGEPRSEQTLTQALTLSDNSAPLTVGRASNGGNELQGIIDEVAIYAAALSEARIADHYAVGVSGR